jgi:hypothetical protein
MRMLAIVIKGGGLRTTYVHEPVREINVLDLDCMIPCSNRSECSNPPSPLLEVLMLLQEDRDLNCPIRNTNDIKHGFSINKFLDNMIEDIIDVLLGISVARDGVFDRVKAEWVLDRTLLRESIPSCLCDCLLASTPPSQLPWIGKYNTWSFRIAWAGGLGLNVLDKINGGARVYSSLAPNYTMCEDTKVLCVFIEENNDPFLVFDVGRDEDGDVGLGFLCTKG